MKYLFTIILFSFFSFKRAGAQTNDSLLITELVRNIAGLQSRENGKYIKGCFPSFRECAGAPHNYRPDNNILFTAIICFTLRNMLADLNSETKRIAAGIIANAQPAYFVYQNAAGFPFYNFWPTGKGILPHTFFIRHFNKLLGMGEDADDAMMVAMASGANDSTCAVLKQRMIEVSNGKKKTIKSSKKKYRNIPAYSTYLGLQMPPDFDLGVHCNTIYFMLDRKLSLVKQDSATIQLLAANLKNRDYIRSPVFVSPYYARRSVLMYHLARLMGKFRIPELDLYLPQLTTDLEKELAVTDDIMDRIILSTSLLKLGKKPAPVNITGIPEFEKSGTDKFIFFQARAAFWYPTAIKKIFLHWSYLQYYFYCPAYNKLLWLEYLLERNRP